jgi:hypothetical protein
LPRDRRAYSSISDETRPFAERAFGRPQHAQRAGTKRIVLYQLDSTHGEQESNSERTATSYHCGPCCYWRFIGLRGIEVFMGWHMVRHAQQDRAGIPHDRPRQGGGIHNSRFRPPWDRGRERYREQVRGFPFDRSRLPSAKRSERAAFGVARGPLGSGTASLIRQ